MEYKFRGKSIESNNWVYGFYVESKGRHFIVDKDAKYICQTIHITSNVNGHTLYNFIEVHPDTVGMFTGRKDKDGVDIWGKSLLTFVNLKDVFVVEWDDTKAGFIVIKVSDTTWREPLGKFKLDFIKAIGTIHDNEGDKMKRCKDCIYDIADRTDYCGKRRNKGGPCDYDYWLPKKRYNPDGNCKDFKNDLSGRYGGQNAN